MGTRGWIRSDEELTEFAFQCDDILNKGSYRNLMRQLNKLARHCKGVGLTTQRQYYHHMDLFLRYLADEFGLRKLSNISGKHIASYVEERKFEGKSAATVKNDVAAIRYYHDQIPDHRNRLPSNLGLLEKYGISLEKRTFGGVDRKWTLGEVEQMIQIALHRERTDIAAMIQLGSGLGLRIHEIVRLSRGDIERAIRSNTLSVKGKGGLIRQVPLENGMVSLLKSITLGVPRGHKLFVPINNKAHEVIRSVQAFILKYRDQVEEKGIRPSGVSLTFHGLRHLYAYERYNAFLENGFSESAARIKVAILIGHSREDVTRIYLAKRKE